MSQCLRVLVLVTVVLCAAISLRGDPLRVFIRAGLKTHGPGQHDHPRFLGEYTKLLQERGLTVDGGMDFPTAAQLEKADVIVIYAADGMRIVGEDRAIFEKYLQRGGGVMVLHDGIVSGDQHGWCKRVVGGAWIWKQDPSGKAATRWHEGEVGVYFTEQPHPITRGISNFDWKDEVYNQLDMAPDVQVLATSFVDVFNIWPQLWTYEKTWSGGTVPYRAFVSIPGHEFASFETPHYRAILLRGIAWAGKRSNVDEFCRPEELNSLRYPAGGPTPASTAVTRMNLHPEFNVTLAADETVAEKIMSLDWDPRGRMWVVETPEYPGARDVHKNDVKIKPWQPLEPEKYPVGAKVNRRPKDRISILEDTNGDGVMDHKTVFADGLELPTSLVFYRDGVIVTQAPDILWIRDTDGDGQADTTEVLYTGWGTFDTHAVISNLRWGPDGWVYGSVGYTRGNVASPKTGRAFGEIAAGIYRFRPDGSALEQMAAGSCNTWGCEITPDGEIVYSTATCGEPICHVIIPETILARGSVPGTKAYLNVIEENKIYPPFQEKRQPYVQIDWVNAWTAAAGACVYDGGAWPAKWAPDDRLSFFMSEATMHLFHHQFLDPKGPTYQGRKEDGRKETEFLTSDDYWFRPIHSRVGPDGAMYVVDFYNQIGVHNDTRGPAHGARNAAARPDRDHHFTRVYRIQHKEAHAMPPFKLDRGTPIQLLETLRHPNGWVRTTANRLLTENPDGLNDVQPQLVQLIADREASPFARVQGLWLYASLARTHTVGWNGDIWRAVFSDRSAAVRKNAVRVAAALTEQPGVTYRVQEVNPVEAMTRALVERLNDTDDRVRIQALMAAGSMPPSPALVAALVQSWPTLKDKWLQSAAVGASAAAPLAYLEAAFHHQNPAEVLTFVPHLARIAANKGDARLAADIVRMIARQPASTDSLKAAVLESLNAGLPVERRPEVDATLLGALKALLASDGSAASVLPFIPRWNVSTRLANEMKPAVTKATAALANAELADGIRGQVAANLVGVRSLDAGILPAVAAVLGDPQSSPELQRRIVDALGATPEGGLTLVDAFPRLSNNLIEPAFGHILKRDRSASRFLDRLADKSINLRTLGPARVHRIRTHGAPAIAWRANEVIDSLAGPEQKEKESLIARLRPVVGTAGNIENGKKVYTANCAACHIFKNEGRNLAPALTGMGAHGAAELLVHIIDPNRLVEPNFISVLIETRGGDTFDGIIERENASEVVLRDATTDHTIRTADIKSRNSTGRGLMPEGFEQLGAENLRDMLAYICADEMRFRILDLSGAFTANNSRGLYNSPENADETVRFRRYGLWRAEEVPFDVVSPEKRVANVVVLRGGAEDSWSRKTLPKRVEVKVGVAAARLHFLGGVAGWGYPAVSDKDLNVMKATVEFTDGSKQEMVFKNGVEIADYNGRHDVPGSKNLNWTTGRGQIRWFSRNINPGTVIEKLVLESYDNSVAPTLFGITAELAAVSAVGDAAGGGDGANPPTVIFPAGNGPRILVVGGGSSHDFERWFNIAEVGTLNAAGYRAAYSEPNPGLAGVIRSADILYLSNNKAFADAESRDAVFAHANAGKGLLLVHPALWYNWGKDWPEYNQVLCGGGSRGHDRYGEFEVTVTDPGHPLMQGVAARFTLSDELYYFEPDSQGTPIRVLATAHSKVKNRTFPIVFIVQHPKARIMGLTLGHDGQSHSHPAYRQILLNAARWAAEK